MTVADEQGRADVDSNLGIVHRAQDELEAAAICFQEALAIQREIADACLALADVHESFGDQAGEEFTLAFPDTDLTVTTSIGVATTVDSYDLPELLTRADRELYRAEHQGKDRVLS